MVGPEATGIAQAVRPPLPATAHLDLVCCLRSQFETYGASRHFVFLRESGRRMIEERVTFADLDRGARAVAVWLKSRPETSRPVLLLFEPGIEFWMTFLGCVYAGVVAVPAPLPHDERSLQRVAAILRDSDSSLVLTSAELRAVIATGIGALGLDRPITCSADDDRPPVNADAWTMPEITPDTVVLLQYTSGSTGDPKGVAVTHDNVLHNEAVIAHALDVTDQAVVVGWVPHFHDMGLFSVLLSFVTGANAVTMSPLAFLKQPLRMLWAISDYRGTHSAAPNFAYDLIARRVTPEQLAGLDLASWRVALNGAEPIRWHTIERITGLLARNGFSPSALRPAYGMAEVTLLATVSRGAPRHLDADTDALERNRYEAGTDHSVRLVSSGEPGPGIEVLVVDPDTRTVLPDGRVGEIWLRSRSVAAGYHGKPVETADRFAALTDYGTGPYLRTGDLGFLHDAQLYVTGRRKDLLIVNGRNLYPQDIEDYVQTLHPALTGARGVAFSVDVDGGERPVVIHTVKSSLLGEVTYAELAATVKRSVAGAFEVPAPVVVFVERGGIHLTTSGKVQRASMRTAFLRSHLSHVLHHSHNAI